MPRSGTTWLARRLASSPHTSLPGREPMNPRGRQFALAGAVDSWVRRESFSPAEAAVVRRCYAGREPRTFSRYGIRQWAAPFSSTRVVIKDPFALLSLVAVSDATGAVPVVLYRHPAAVLASYRRMEWTADTDEMSALGAPPPRGPGDLEQLAAMWTWCHQVVLSDLSRLPDYVVVSHQRLTAGGAAAWRTLGERLGVQVGAEEPRPTTTTHVTQAKVLHDFERPRSDVESGWRQKLDAEEISVMEERVADVWTELETIQLPLPTAEVDATEDPT